MSDMIHIEAGAAPRLPTADAQAVAEYEFCERSGLVRQVLVHVSS